MEKPFKFTSEDSFVLTFIAAWMGVRLQHWNSNIQLGLLIIIAGTFAYSTVVSQVRYWIKTKDYSSINPIFIFGFLVTILVAVFIIFSSYMPIDDKNTSGFFAFCWFALPIIEHIANIKELRWGNRINKPSSHNQGG